MSGNHLRVERHGHVIDRVLAEFEHSLPSQGPIIEFIHHNTLHSYLHLPFEAAVLHETGRRGARVAVERSFWREAVQTGKISPEGIELASHESGVDSPSLKRFFAAMAAGDQRGYDIARAAPHDIRAKWDIDLYEMDAATAAFLAKLLANFLDQGISICPPPQVESVSFFALVRDLSAAKPGLWRLSDIQLRQLWRMTSDQQIEWLLNRLVGDDRSYGQYLDASLRPLNGWLAAISQIQRRPNLLHFPRRVGVKDVIAIKLLLDYAVITRELSIDFPSLRSIRSSVGLDDGGNVPVTDDFHHVGRASHLALEWSYYLDLIGKLRQSANHVSLPLQKAQFIFCIDDRECSLRRSIEALDPSFETFGTPGFFGMDFFLQKATHQVPMQSCPIALTAKHLVREEPITNDPLKGDRLHGIQHPRLRTVAGTLLHLPLAGVASLLHMTRDLLWSKMRGDRNCPMTHRDVTGLQLIRPAVEEAQHGSTQAVGVPAPFFLGYAPSELAERIARTLRSIGLTDGFAPWVFIVGHGSQSVNNPYHSAYSCGACGGKPGGDNARAFVRAINDERVRRLLREQHGIDVPSQTQFVGGIHDTCKDTITFFDEDAHQDPDSELARVKASLERALDENALERATKFHNFNPKKGARAARRHVMARSRHIFEPRPELGHATNAACVIGRRSLTKGLSLDRRAFLNSYDPKSDESGDILESILSAAVPVCGGISLEYYFSRLDPLRFGSASKLSHNVAGLVGIGNGMDSDLLTGLPMQMTDFHDPVRILFVIEQHHALVHAVFTRNKSLAPWYLNQWIRVATVNPDDRSKVDFYLNGQFRPYEDLRS